MSSALRIDPPGYSLQPFEKRLAELERQLAGDPRQAHRLAFAASVGDHPTHQYYYDRFVKLTRRAAAHDVALVELASSVRDGHRAEAHNYLTHGIHSYKGKYFPQIVRSLVNTAGAGVGSLVVDPFAGSGTTTLEAALMGVRGVGVDRNPLAVLIARTKIDALRLTIDHVRAGELAVIAQLESGARAELPNLEYLERWFPAETLVAITRILGAIEAATAEDAFKDLARLALSTHLRSWSLQEPSQLRIFRRSEAPPASALVDRFVVQLAEYANVVAVGVRLLAELGIRLPDVRLDLADSREMGAWGCPPTSVDAVITSPPYATALPYIDTDRLSIFCLGLAQVQDRSGLEWEMIGTREILTKQRKELEEALTRNAAQLPAVVVGQILSIKSANDKASVGFRRRNLPALLYRYFIDMRSVLRNAGTALRSGGLCAVVIGDSYTVAGNKKVRIRTADFLTAIAEEAGLHCIERIPMGGQTAYLPHQRNGIPAERILLFAKS